MRITFIKIFNTIVRKVLMIVLVLQFFQKNVRNFSQKFGRTLFGNFRSFRKNSDRKLFQKFFRKIVGNFFVRRPVRKPSEIPPGLFRKTGGLFVSIRFGNVCFLHKFRGKIRMVSLRIPVVSRKLPGGISPGIPENSGGKPGVFFWFFLGFTAATQG